MRSILAVSLALLIPIAGCIGDDGGDELPQEAACEPVALDPEGIRMVPTDHDPFVNRTRENATIFEDTFLRTCSLTAIGHHTLREETPHKYLGELDMRGDLDLGAVAVLGNGEEPGVYILDISDRAAPQVLSFIQEANTYLVDVKFSEDGDLLFTASQSIPIDPELQGLPELQSPQGFSVYDISDPSDPTYLTTVADSGYGCHMMSHRIIDGQDVLFCVSQHIRAYLLEREDGSVRTTGFVDYVLDGDEGAPKPGAPSVPVGTPAELAEVRRAVFDQFASRPHDITTQVDEGTGKTLGIVSHWGEGVRIVDLDGLVGPTGTITELGSWKGEGATHYYGNVHTAMMFYVGTDRYVVATPEITFGGAVPSIWVLDANDFGDMRLVAEWFHPGEHESQGLFLTTHQWQVAPTGADVNASDVRIYLTYNHAGVWVLDLGAILEGDDQGAILGFNMARTEYDTDDMVSNAILATWDINVVDGHIYGSDRATGLWVFHYAEDTLGDTRLTGFA